MNERIKQLRKHLGLNQENFGLKIGLTRSAICNYENGSRTLTEQTIMSICREFNVNRTWLVEGTGDMFAEPRNVLDELAIQFNLSDIEQDAVKRFCDLPKEQRFAIASFLTSKK